MTSSSNDIHSCRMGSNEIPITVRRSRRLSPNERNDGFDESSIERSLIHNDDADDLKSKLAECHSRSSGLREIKCSGRSNQFRLNHYKLSSALYLITLIVYLLSAVFIQQVTSYNITHSFAENAGSEFGTSHLLRPARYIFQLTGRHKRALDGIHPSQRWPSEDMMLAFESSKLSARQIKSRDRKDNKAVKTSSSRQTTSGTKSKRNAIKSPARGQQSWYEPAATQAASGTDWTSVKSATPKPMVSRFRRTGTKSSSQQPSSKLVAQRRTRPQVASESTTRPLNRPIRQQVGSAPMALALTAPADLSNKCALILKRTFVSETTLPTTNSDASEDNETEDSRRFEPTGRQETICITYEDVNQAISDAKRRRGFVSVPASELISVEPSLPVVAELGELNQETTKILAKKFDLSNDEILNGLPLIDMSRTDFWQICPLMVKPVQCDPNGRFRSFTGHCNNLEQPTWGAAQTPFVRYLPPKHPDGIQADRVSALDGSPLPSPRLITSMVHRDHDQPSGDLSLLIMVWGQIVDHDIALAAPPRDEQGMDFNCCKRQHPNCKPIQIPADDPLYSRHGQLCMDFKRSLAGLRPNCALGPRVHINTITSTMDANTIYGSTKAVADQLRTFSGGELKVQDVFANIGLKPLLPKQLIRPDLDCFGRPNPDTYCFLGGDERVNEQPTLTALHTLYVRDHNRIAKRLAQLNPHWDDDRIYHETRHIEAAIVQHILISEYLPLLIGHEMMIKYNLTAAPPNTYWNGYDPTVTTSISQGFSTAAFRQGHTFIQGKVRFYDSRTYEFVGSMMLRSLFKRPFHYYKPGRMDEVVAGIINTPAQVYDPFVTEEISGHLFQEPGESFGMDLPAINLARGREQGVPGYNAYRKWCGLGAVKSFAELQPLMANRTALLYSKLYKHVDDIDLWSGGISERRMAGSQIGPTFACIIARQFSSIKRGDRFWFENSGFPSAFTLDQLREIKKATQARLLCYNSDNLLTIQQQALKLPHPIYNPRIRCSDIPDLNLNFWREDPSTPGSFFTSSSARTQIDAVDES